MGFVKERLFTQALHLYPKASTYYISSKNDDTESFGSQLTEVVFVLMPRLASKEIARITGNMELNGILNNKKIELAISKLDEKEYNQRISIACIEAIQARYHFFPEE